MSREQSETQIKREISRTEYYLQWGLILAMVGFGIAFFYVVITHGF